MGRGGDAGKIVLSRSVSGGRGNEHDATKKELKFCMLGCETKPPYGPNKHTADLLLDLLCMAAKKHNDSIRWNISIHVFDVQSDEYPTTWDNYNGFLLPGSFSSAYDTDPWILKLNSVLQTEIVSKQRPCLAICFGHQVLAHSFEDGKATPVPSGARGGRFTAKCTHGGSKLFEKADMDLYFTHGDMVEKLPSSAICLGGDQAVPIQCAAYFRSAQEATRFQEEENNGNRPKPFAVTFHAHPEYATSVGLGLERTLEGCLAAMEKLGKLEKETRSRASHDARESFEKVQKDSIQTVVRVCCLLGWFPDQS